MSAHRNGTAPGSDLSLLLPAWQGYGLDATPAAGARALAATFARGAFIEVDAPDGDPLRVEDGVLGLSSIAAHAACAIRTLGTHQPARLFTIGATCGVELAPVAYLNERYRGDLAVVWLDAHGDLNTPRSSPSGRFHGMVLRTLLGDGPAALAALVPRRLSPSQIVLAGARDLDRDEATFASDTAMSVLAPADLLVPDRVAGRVRAAGFTRIYVHLDVDVLDPEEFPDSLVPTPHGTSVGTLVETMQTLAGTFAVVGFSVVEFRPRGADAVSRLRDLLRHTGIGIGALASV